MLDEELGRAGDEEGARVGAGGELGVDGDELLDAGERKLGCACGFFGAGEGGCLLRLSCFGLDHFGSKLCFSGLRLRGLWDFWD